MNMFIKRYQASSLVRWFTCHWDHQTWLVSREYFNEVTTYVSQ